MNITNSNKAFSCSADKFSNPQYWKKITPPIKALFEILKERPEIEWQKWLDLGCGAGVCFTHFPTDCQVTAVDYSEGLLRHARATIEKDQLKNIKLFNQDIDYLKFEDRHYDGAMLFQVYPHLNPEVLSLLNKYLRRGGWLIIAYGADTERINCIHHQHPQLASRPLPLGIHMKMDFTNANIKFEQEINLSPQEVAEKSGMESVRPLIAFMGRKII